MKFETTELPGVVVVEPVVHHDERGFLLEVFHQEKFRDGGLDLEFVQDNHTCSSRSILRGLHAQVEQPQGKLVRAIEGEIWDVAVDIRPSSPSFCQWYGLTLSADNFRQLYIPPGFAHGFFVKSARAQVEYKCTGLYAPEAEITIAWNDPQIGIAWPLEGAEPVLSERDRQAPPLAQLTPRLRSGLP